jgi:polysaccharide export outer membrane protein
VGAALALPILLAGCAAITASGRSGSEIRSQVKADISHLGIALVPVKNVADLLKPVVAAPLLAPDYTPGVPTRLVGVGDVLDISIYESGNAVFGHSHRPPGKPISIPPSRQNACRQRGSAMKAQSTFPMWTNCP